MQPLQQQLADLREAGRRAGEDLAAARGELRAEREKNAVAVAEIEALNAALRKKQGELAAAKRAADGLELDAAEALRSSQRAEAAAQAKGAVAEERMWSAELAAADTQRAVDATELERVLAERTQVPAAFARSNPFITPYKSPRGPAIFTPGGDAEDAENRTEEDGNLTISEARQLLIDAEKFDSKVRAHTGYAQFCAMNVGRAPAREGAERDEGPPDAGADAHARYALSLSAARSEREKFAELEAAKDAEIAALRDKCIAMQQQNDKLLKDVKHFMSEGAAALRGSAPVGQSTIGNVFDAVETNLQILMADFGELVDERLRGCDRRVANLFSTVAVMDGRMGALKGTAVRALGAEAEAAELKRIEAELTEKIEEAEMALVDTADTLEETIEEKELALERIDELEAQLEDESGRVNELSAALRASDKTEKDLEQEIGGLEAKGEGLAAEVARYREELDAQAHQLAVSREAEGEQGMKLAEDEIRIEQLSENLSGVEEEYGKLREAHRETKKELGTIKAEHAKLRKTFERLKTKSQMTEESAAKKMKAMQEEAADLKQVAREQEDRAEKVAHELALAQRRADELDAEVQDLSAKHAAEQGKVVQLNRALESAHVDLDASEAAKAELQDRVGELQRETKGALRALDDEQDRAAALARDHQELKEEAADAARHLREVTAAADRLESSNAELEGLSKRQERSIESLGDDLTSARARAQDLTEQLNAKAEALAELTARAEATEGALVGELRDIKNTVLEKDLLLDQRESKTAALEDRVRSLDELSSKQGVDLRGLAEENKENRAAREALEKDLAVSSAEVEMMGVTVGELEAERAKHVGQIERLMEKLDGATLDYNHATIQSRELEATSKKQEEQIAALKRQTGDLQGEVQSLARKAQKLEVLNQDLESGSVEAVREFEGAAEALRLQVAGLEVTAAQTKEELEECQKSELMKTRAKMELEKEVGVLKDQVLALERQNVQLEKEAAEAEASCEQALKTMEDLTVQRDRAEQRAGDAASQVNDVQLKLESEKRKSQRVVEQLSTQLVGSGKAKEAQFAKDLVALQRALEETRDPGRREELVEQIERVKLGLGAGNSTGSTLALQSSLDKEREHRVRLEQELAEAFDAQLESQKETESVLVEYEALVEENKALADKVEELSASLGGIALSRMKA